MKTAKLMTILMAAIAIMGCTGNKEKENLKGDIKKSTIIGKTSASLFQQLKKELGIK